MKLGFIGAGNMGSAIVGGVIRAGIFSAENIIVSDAYQPMLDKIKQTHGVNITNSNLEVASSSDVIFLAIKPNIYEPVIKEIREKVKPGAIVITIAAGQTLKGLTDKFSNDNVKIVRTMPNTPALVQQGMTAVCPAGNLNDEDKQLVLKIFNSIGKAEILSEYLFDAYTGIAGSGPAYVFMFIEAMADGGVLHGLPRDQAMKFAAQTVLGSAEMILSGAGHPGFLKDAVCSPGGTTIEAVATLEKNGFRNAVISAVSACSEKSLKMSQ